MSLTSYRAAPPRAIKLKIKIILSMFKLLIAFICNVVFFSKLIEKVSMHLADLAATYSPVP